MAARSSPTGAGPSWRSTSASGSSRTRSRGSARPPRSWSRTARASSWTRARPRWPSPAQLKARGGWSQLTVITNGLRLASELAGSNGITVLMLGGRVRWEALSVVGQLGDGLFSRINVQKAFLGAAGFTIESGLSDATDEEAQIKRSMVAAAREVIAIVDSTKWERAAFATFCPTDEIDVVLTDERAPDGDARGPARARHRGPADRSTPPVARRGPDATDDAATVSAAESTAASASAAARRELPARHLEAVRRDPGARRRLARPAVGRGPRPRRRERRRQEHARQDPRRRPPARQRHDLARRRRDRPIQGPAHARALGIAVVHQEPRLFPDLTVAENVFIGHAPSGRLGHDRLGRDAAGGAGAVQGARRPVRCRRAGPGPVDGRPAADRDRQVPLGRRPRPHPRRADGLALGPRGRAALHDRPPPARSRRRRSCS